MADLRARAASARWSWPRPWRRPTAPTPTSTSASASRGACLPQPAPQGTRTRPPVAREQVDALLAERRTTLVDRASTHDRFADDLVNLLGDEHRPRGRRPAACCCRCGSSAARPPTRRRCGSGSSRRPARRASRRGRDATPRSAGTAYWEAVWADGDPQAPWPALVAAVGKAPGAVGGRGAAPDQPRRPAGRRPDVPRPAASDQRPRGRAHAARPLLRAHRAGRRRSGDRSRPADPRRAAGRAGRPGRPRALLVRDGEDLPPIDESLRWLVDYEEAERLGMALTVAAAAPRPGGPQADRLRRPGRARARRGAARLERLRPLAPLHRRRRVRAAGHADEQHRLRPDVVEPAYAARPTRPGRRRRTGPGSQRRRDGGGAGDRARTCWPPCPNGDGRRAGARPRRSTRRCGRTTWGDAIETLTPGGAQQR